MTESIFVGLVFLIAAICAFVEKKKALGGWMVFFSILFLLPTIIGIIAIKGM
jgi:hypothetical protein